MPSISNLVHESATTTGTGNFTLASINGKQTFNTAFGTGGTDVFYYFISNRAAAEWEVGTGHLSAATTLVRDTVLASSNSGSAVNFSAGQKDVVNDVPAASQPVALATAAQTTTGTDATRAVTPDGLAGSDFGKTVVSILVFDDSLNVTVADGAGDMFFRIPAVLNGYNLVAVAAAVQTAGTTGTTDIQIHNVTQAADMLTTKITIDTGETDSSTAATAAVIDTANDDVATGDRIRIDVDAVSTTPPKGLLVELTFQLP